MTSSNQNPLNETRVMLDELGNLQSEGPGIAGLETILSIGLGVATPSPVAQQLAAASGRKEKPDSFQSIDDLMNG